MANADYNVLDLFAGLGGFSAAFDDSDRWDVTTVEINDEFDPDIEADIFDLRPSDFDQDFDVILASPPCTYLSYAGHHSDWEDRKPKNKETGDHVALAIHAVGLIKGLAPKYWFLENPRDRMRWILDSKPTGTVSYCQYGEDMMKPTDLWGEHPIMSYKSCHPTDDCHEENPGGRAAHNGSDDPYSNSHAERSKVPYDLSEAIRDACEAGLDGDAIEQQTLAAIE